MTCFTPSAYATHARLVVAQLGVPGRPTRSPLLDQLAQTKQLEGSLVSIGAMGCHVAIAGKIVAHKADYLLTLKGINHLYQVEFSDTTGRISDLCGVS